MMLWGMVRRPVDSVAIFNAKRARCKRPCPIWVDAFLRDTQHLDADEIGAYFLILIAMWIREGCNFPAEPARLARISRVSLRLWRARIGPAILPLLAVLDGMVFSKRLREEASFVEAYCKAQSARKISPDNKRGTYAFPDVTSDPSGVDAEKSHKLLINNNEPSTTDDPRMIPGSILSTTYNLQEEEDGGGGSACAREAVAKNDEEPEKSPTFREQILLAIRVDPSGMTGHGGTMIGTQADMIEAGRWIADLGLTEAEVLAEITSVMAHKSDGQPSGFKFFTKAMQRLAAAKAAPPIQMIHAAPGGRNDRHKFDTDINRLADSLSEGRASIDTSDRDPFAAQPRQVPETG